MNKNLQRFHIDFYVLTEAGDEQDDTLKNARFSLRFAVRLKLILCKRQQKVCSHLILT